MKAFKEGEGLISIDDQTRNDLHRLCTAGLAYEWINEQRKDVISKFKLCNRVDSVSAEEIAKSFFSAPPDSPIDSPRKERGDLSSRTPT